MKNYLKAVSVNNSTDEGVFITKKKCSSKPVVKALTEYQQDYIKNLLSATAGKLSILSNMIRRGEECLCSGSMQDATVSILDDIENAMYNGMDVLENKEKEG